MRKGGDYKKLPNGEVKLVHRTKEPDRTQPENASKTKKPAKSTNQGGKI